MAMTAYLGHIGFRRRLALPGAGAWLIALACALSMSFAAVAQEQAQPPSGPAAAPPAEQESLPPFRPGFLEALGRWLGDSKAVVDSQIKSTQETIGGIGSQASDAAKDALGVARDAAGAVAGLPNARIVSGRERCEQAPNGAPDCRPAVGTLCRGKGFASGKSLDISSAQKCPAWVWLSGRKPAEGDCSVETFVTRAVCQ
jgi:hypothetical protein